MKRRDEVLVGIFTLAAVAVLIAGTLWLARGGLSRGYPLYAKFPWGAGLKQGQSVLFSGVNVGYVDKVNLLENGGLVVEMRVYKSQRVPTGTVASIISNGIFGDMQIALKASGPTGRFLAAGDTIPSGPGAIGMGDVIARVDTIGTNLNKLILALHNEFVDQNTVGDVRKATRGADSMFAMIGRLAEAQNRELTRTQEALRGALSSLDSIPLDSAVRELREGARHVTMLTDDLRETSATLRRVVAKADTGSGTLAKLLNDPKLEQEFRAALTSFNTLVADFMKDPRRYIKLSIF